MWLTTVQVTRRHNPEELNLHQHHCDNFKCHIYAYIFNEGSLNNQSKTQTELQINLSLFVKLSYSDMEKSFGIASFLTRNGTLTYQPLPCDTISICVSDCTVWT